MDQKIRLRPSLDYIDRNLSGEIRLEDLARLACLSKYHYHRLFHQEVGESVNRYISRKRMERAASELTETDQPIIEIALKYQYASQEAFSRAFKRTYAQTPGRYRRLFARARMSSLIPFGSYSDRTNQLAA